MGTAESRRLFIVASGVEAANLLFGCRGGVTAAQAADTEARRREACESEAPGGDEPEVSATEDLMREHGVIRRMIVVYREAAARFREQVRRGFPLDALQRAAKLFRAFGEDYHERQLEEAHIFPTPKRARWLSASAAVDTLVVPAQPRDERSPTS